MQDWPADGSAFLVAMKALRRVGEAAQKLALLVEVIIRGKNVRPENSEGVAMEFVAAGFTRQADDAGCTALVGSWSVLCFDSIFVHAVFRNFRHGNDGGNIVFRDPQRTAVKHVIDGPEDGAVDAVRRDVHSWPAARNVVDLRPIR